jgi:hypothetical protein
VCGGRSPSEGHADLAEERVRRASARAQVELAEHAERARGNRIQRCDLLRDAEQEPVSSQRTRWLVQRGVPGRPSRPRHYVRVSRDRVRDGVRARNDVNDGRPAQTPSWRATRERTAPRRK